MTPHAFYRTDANQGEIAAALEAAGNHVTKRCTAKRGEYEMASDLWEVGLCQYKSSV